MIKEGGIYSKDKEIRIVVEIDDEIVHYYSINDEPLINTTTRDQIQQILKEDWLVGSSLNYHSIFYKSFKDLNDGYLGKIDEYLLIELQSNFEKIKELITHVW